MTPQTEYNPTLLAEAEASEGICAFCQSTRASNAPNAGDMVYAPSMSTSPSASGPVATPPLRSCVSWRSASAAARIAEILPRMTLIASGMSSSGLYALSDSMLTACVKAYAG